MKTHPSCFSRRAMLQSLSAGFGYMAFNGLQQLAQANPLTPKAGHFAAKAKRVIFLCMRGGPSHLDTFDYKPKLIADSGKMSPFRRGQKLLAPKAAFKQRGSSGLWISDLFPSVAEQADSLCLLRGMQTDIPNHPQAFVQLHTGSFQFVRPSMGAWILYGLGTENTDLPGFITLGASSQNGGAQNYGSSFLPAYTQGVRIGAEQAGPAAANRSRLRGGNEGLANIANPRLNKEAQRKQLDLVQSMNDGLLIQDPGNKDVEGAIEAMELGYRMQAAVPKHMDLTKESPETLKLYGIGDDATDAFGKQCLMARRFAEAGVRFIEIGHGNWDHHRDLEDQITQNCQNVDKPIAGLLADLKSRDLLKDTLVIWGGEFGRTPDNTNDNGRDHNNKGFTMWMAGGGVKGGYSHGTTDDYGHEALDGKVHIHDLHATILHLLGLNHERLTYKYAGRDFRLTDVHGNVAKEIIA